MKPDASGADVQKVLQVIEALGFRGHTLPGENRTAIGVTGNRGSIDPAHFENLPGVADAIRVTKPYKLISKELRPERSVIKVGNANIGGPELAMIAGPCALEDHQQVFATAETVAASGAKFFRGGAFKPRTSPYAFQGLGEEGLKMLAEVRDQFGLNIVTEAMDEHGVDACRKIRRLYSDRCPEHAKLLASEIRRSNSHTCPLRSGGYRRHLTNFCLQAEYIMAEGNYDVILCERGHTNVCETTQEIPSTSLLFRQYIILPIFRS
jgi:3-deoxy-7-phosphoheptulonate synthase